MRHVLRITILAGSIFATGPLTARAQARRTFAKPDAELTEPFSQVASIRELSDGRVIVIDTKENRLVLVDFAKRTVTDIGRRGSGPSEWQRPIALYPLRADTTLVQDPNNGRFLVLGPSGTPVGPWVPTGGGRGLVRSVDARGRMYYSLFTAPVPPTAPVAPTDSTPVVRYDPDTKQHDTLAFVHTARVVAAVGGTKESPFRMTVTNPFAPSDDWAVLHDGRVVIARANDYHIEIVGIGVPRVQGERVPFTPDPVTEADKHTWRQARFNAVQVARGGALPPDFPLPDPEWTSKKPPFGPRAVTVTPTGEIWVLRNGRQPDSSSLIDVFNQRGQRTSQVILPKGTILVGFGAASTYLVRTDDDGLQYLQRHPLVR